MSKFEMKGYPSHHTGVQPKGLTNPLRFGIRAGEEDYTKFNALQPFANSAWGGVFSARGEYDAIHKGKSNKPRKPKKDNQTYTTDPNQAGPSVMSPTNAPSQGGQQVQGVNTSNSTSAYSWP